MHRQTSRLRWIHFTVKLWNGQSICSLPWQYIVSLDIHFVTLMNGFSSKHQLFTFFNSLPVSFLHSLLTFNADYVSSMYFYNEFTFSWMFSHQTLCLVYRRPQVQRQRDEKLYVITCHNENMFECMAESQVLTICRRFRKGDTRKVETDFSHKHTPYTH